MLTCMLIDDDRDEIDIFSMALRELDVEVECRGYTHCTEAVNTLATGQLKPDFIFLDSNLSGINGKDCLRQIKQLPGLHTTPVIVLSGFISDPERQEYKTLGATECLTKANSVPDLRSKLADFFQGTLKAQR